VTEMSRV